MSLASVPSNRIRKSAAFREGSNDGEKPTGRKLVLVQGIGFPVTIVNESHRQFLGNVMKKVSENFLL